ncbi:hypothetical protein B0H14DRAFT_2593758 [Mycena olivaceomarginata]|nr:hypothetical protein B0H14DRAFT_2593758 [Mycena olivaceomarginata]
MPSRSYALPLTLRRHNHLVVLPMMKSADQHLPPEAQGGFFLRSSLPLPLFPFPSLPPAFLPQVRVCVNDAFVAQAAGPEDHARIVDAICADASALSEAATDPEERHQIVPCMRGRIDTVTDHVPHNSKALDCEGEVCLLIVSELHWAAPTTTRVNKHASHMWSKHIAPPLLVDADSILLCSASTSSSWAARPRETRGEPQDGIIDELLAHGAAVFGEVAKSQWGSYCIQHSTFFHLLYHDHPILITHRYSPRTRVGEAPPNGARAPPYCPAPVHGEQVGQQERGQGTRGGRERDARARRPAHARVSEGAKTDRCAALYDCIRAQIVPRCACKTGSKVIWLLYVHPMQFILNPLSSVGFSSDRMRAYYEY